MTCALASKLMPVGVVTVRVAAALVTFGAMPLETVTVKLEPESSSPVAGVVKVAAVAPVMAAPFLDHW
jgi:hypothetical protein